MIGSLLKEIQPIPETDDKAAKVDPASDSGAEDFLISALPVVEKIVQGKRLSWRSEASDLIQSIFLRLLKWRNKYQDKSEKMSAEDWKSFAATTTFNELNRSFKEDRYMIEIPLESAGHLASEQLIEGNSMTEFQSYAMYIWKQFRKHGLRERQAMLLGSYELAAFLLYAGVTDEELAESLNMPLAEWLEVKDKLPVKDRQFIGILKDLDQRSAASVANSMKKARSLARQKVRRVTNK